MAYIGKQPGTGVRNRFLYTATAGQTTFTTSDSNLALSYSDALYMDVYLNGVLLDPANDYTATSGTSVVLGSGATAGDVLEIVVYDVFSVFNNTIDGNFDVAGNTTLDNNLTVGGDLTVDTSTLKVDSTNNRVGIGTTSPDEVLEVSGDVKSSGSNFGIYHFGETSDVTKIVGRDAGHASFPNTMDFFTNSTQRMRLDSSGNLLVGMTSGIGTFTNAGVGISSSSNYIHAIRDGNIPLFVGRKTSDGEIIRLYMDGTVVGSLGSRLGAESFISLGSSGLTGSSTGGGSLLPTTGGDTYADNVVDLGFSSGRFDNIYATNTSIIGTSDSNEKQQIASLTEAEITAAKALSKLFKTFKWNSAVESKGDNARTHTGHIAQEVQSAMTDAGLDATKYAFFCSDTWWETQTEVPAVEADEENGIEAQDAYTRTDTYHTAEEAPEGATERTRLGIRYPELLAFIGAATEQRLADIETRLTALEAE